MGIGGGLGWRGRALGTWALGVALTGVAALTVTSPALVTSLETTGRDVSVVRTADEPDHDPDLPPPTITTSTAVPRLEADDAPPAEVDDDLDPTIGDDDGLELTIRWDPGDLGLDIPALPVPGGRVPSSLPPGTVRITAVDDAGTPIAGACVDLLAFPGNSEPFDAPERNRNGVTGADGSFTASFDLSRAPAGYPPGLPPLIAVNVRPCTFPPAFFFDGGVLEPGILQEVTVALVRSAALRGRVLLDGAPVAGQCVTAWTVDPQPHDDGSPTLTGPGIVEVDPAYLGRSITGADGSFHVPGLVGGRTAHVAVSEGCDGPAWEWAGAPIGGDFWPQGLRGGVVFGAGVPMGTPGTTTTATVEVRAPGDLLADAPTMDAPFYGFGTYLGTRSATDPVPSCAPEATGATVWRRAAYSGDRIGYGIRVDHAAALAAYEPTGAGLVEVGCVVLADGENRNGLWSLPPGAVVLVQGLTGTTTGSFTHFPM